MWTWIIVAAVAVAIATLILWRQRTRKGTGGTPDNMRARAGKARKMDGGKSGGYPGKTGGFTPGNPG